MNTPKKWASDDAHRCYDLSHSYSRGSYSASTTYEGDDPGCDPDEQWIKGTFGVQAVFTGYARDYLPG